MMKKLFCGAMAIVLFSTQSFAMVKTTEGTLAFAQLRESFDEMIQNFESNADQIELVSYQFNKIIGRGSEAKRVSRLEAKIGRHLNKIKHAVSHQVDALSDDQVAALLNTQEDTAEMTSSDISSQRETLKTNLFNSFQEQIPTLSREIVQAGGLTQVIAKAKAQMLEFSQSPNAPTVDIDKVLRTIFFTSWGLLVAITLVGFFVSSPIVLGLFVTFFAIGLSSWVIGFVRERR